MAAISSSSVGWRAFGVGVTPPLGKAIRGTLQSSLRCVFFVARCTILLALPVHVGAHSESGERIAALTEEIARNPNNAELYLKRGELHRFDGDWAAAAADYERAAQVDPGLSAVDLARGSMLLEAGRPQAAQVALDRFLAKQPDHPAARLARARVLVQRGQRLAAAEDFTRALAQLPDPTPEPYLERAQALAAEGEGHIDAALRGLDEGMKKIGPLVTLQLLAIDLELRKKRYDAALARLEQVAARSKRKERWLARRGEILAQAGRSQEAREAFAQALAAIESLPTSRGKAKAVAELEARLRSALEGQAAELPRGAPAQQR